MVHSRKTISLFLVGFLCAASAVKLSLAGQYRALTPIKKVSTSFDPSQLSNLKLWLRADLGVTKDGSNNVSTWVDQSSNAYSFSGTVSTNKPVWSATAGPNSTNAMTFSTLQYFANSSVSLNSSGQAFSIYIVVSTTSTPATISQPLYVRTGTNKDVQLFFWNNASYQYLFWGDDTNYPAWRVGGDFSATSTFYAVSFTYDNSGVLGGYNVYSSNVAKTTSSAPANAGAGTNTLIGNYLTGGTPSGPIAEVVMQDSVATSLERSNMQTYFNTRYGL